MRLFFVLMTGLAFPFTFQPDVKEAIWSAGTPGANDFESFAFWVKSDKRAYIRYQHDTSSDDIELRWLGPGTESSRRGFWAAFPRPGNRTIFITPINDSVLLITTHGGSRKYRWVDENADPGSNCDICAASAAEATGWLRRYFWN